MKKTTKQYEPVDASPVKSFFVAMFTRDIKLEDAILDLLDNCVDGILRTGRRSSGKKPYQGFGAEITFDKDSFVISDNCGGIPWSLHEYAFRMGRTKDRPADKPGTVGAYGIGMKRAIFKMGKECLIGTKSGADEYEVHITPEWIADEKEWHIPVAPPAKKSMKEDGTTIIIEELYPGIRDRFGADSREFESELRRMVATHYAFIIDNGFQVTINGEPVTPKPTRLIFSRGETGANKIRPFFFRTRTEDGVDIFLAVGFTRPIPSVEEAADEQEETRYSSVDAGWTVLCNDRAVLYCDRSELTGWGEAGVPRYHTQFIAIAGVVEFKSADPSKLPTTTTKRGIDAASPLYLQVKNKMREGMRLFINYTNKWKGRTEEAKRHIEGEEALPFNDIKREANKLHFRWTTRTVLKGEQYKPDLPLPKKLEPKIRRISFTKDAEEIETVATHLFEDRSTEPSLVGERCFDIIYKEASR